MTQKQIAEAISNGNFEAAYPFLSPDISWNIIGENHLKGRQAVIDHCERTANYFKSVVTEFKTLNVLVDKKHVVINGTAAFIRDNKRIAFVSACDIYEFNDRGELDNISSYCIPDKEK